MTIQDAKDQVAKKYGWASFDEYYQQGNKLDILAMMDDAFQIYGDSQYKRGLQEIGEKYNPKLEELEILRKRCEDLEAALEVETNNAVDRGKIIIDLMNSIERAYDWLKNPGVPIQSVITVLRKAKEKKTLNQIKS